MTPARKKTSTKSSAGGAKKTARSGGAEKSPAALQSEARSTGTRHAAKIDKAHAEAESAVARSEEVVATALGREAN